MSKARQLADLGNQVDDGAITGSNMVINGGMTVAQRGTQTAQTSGYTACDRWQFAENGASVVTTTQDSNIPAGEGFGSSLKVDVTNASGTPSSGNYAFLRTKFEGAKPLTLSFWVSSPKTGIHVVELYDTDNDRQVSKSYTINSVNTWQHVSVLMPADTTGAFNDDNLISMQIAFWLMAGSNFSGGTLNTSWAANNNSNRAVGQVNCMDNTSNNFYLTGVCLNNDPDWYFPFVFPEMRAAPTVTFSGNPLLFCNSDNSDTTSVTSNSNNDNRKSLRLQAFATAVGSAGQAGWLQLNAANSYFTLDAEL